MYEQVWRHGEDGTQAWEMARAEEHGPTLGAYPIPGLIRRARRIAGFSQRQMAASAGLSRSTVQRAETGDLIPSMDALQRILAVAALHLVVIDDAGHVVMPMEDWQGGVRDGAGRRYPAHLHVVLDPALGEWWADIYGFERPPETFHRDPPEVREYRRRLSAWQVRKKRYLSHLPPSAPVAWVEYLREKRAERSRAASGRNDGLSGPILLSETGSVAEYEAFGGLDEAEDLEEFDAHRPAAEGTRR
ncbi:helix-turn-helix domain-containing protein [Actinomadura scrupuli]|uniref:helix-turn-helix domain-containing protein n=1 Tax=Actinomadura scrupuli TaxID=559629 RepID=UPI003D9833D5